MRVPRNQADISMPWSSARAAWLAIRSRGLASSSFAEPK
jgi:hypothetical protein